MRLLFFIALFTTGCASEADPRIASPQATVVTLLEATHLREARSFADLSGPRPQPDIDKVALCFWDYDRDDLASRAMGEFVAGMLAARQGQLLYRVGDDRATAEAGSIVVHFRKTRKGWHIALGDTIPAELRHRLSAPRPPPDPEHEMP